MTTTLELACRVFGWQGGTIHDIKKRCAVASLVELDKLCGILVDNMSNISDYQNVAWFTEHRLKAVNQYTHAVSKVVKL